MREVPFEARRGLGIDRDFPWWASSDPQHARPRHGHAAEAHVHERLDEIGIDFALLYPTFGLIIFNIADDEIRRAMRPRVQPLLRRVRTARHRRSPRRRWRRSPCSHARGGPRAELDYAVRRSRHEGRAWLAGFTRVDVPGGGRHAAAASMDGHVRPIDSPLRLRAGVAALRPSSASSPTFHSSGMGWGSAHLARRATSITTSATSRPVARPICRGMFLGGVAATASRSCASASSKAAWPGPPPLPDLIGHFEQAQPRLRRPLRSRTRSTARSSIELFARYGRDGQALAENGSTSTTALWPF